MKKIFLLILSVYIIQTVSIAGEKRISSISPTIAHRIHNEQGERVGTVRRENNVFKFYDMNNKEISNPAQFMKQPENECYLYSVDGYAIGRCTSKRVILWK